MQSFKRQHVYLAPLIAKILIISALAIMESPSVKGFHSSISIIYRKNLPPAACYPGSQIGDGVGLKLQLTMTRTNEFYLLPATLSS
jgi:hypothetical protein